MGVRSYDPAQVKIILSGIPISGFQAGTFISVERNNPSFNDVVGADGEGARSKTNDKSATITVTLMQTSDSNDLLSELIAADELSGSGVGPFLLKDNSGRTLLEAQTAWLERPANVSYGQEVETREWTIKTDALDMVVGGTPIANA